MVMAVRTQGSCMRAYQGLPGWDLVCITISTAPDVLAPVWALHPDTSPFSCNLVYQFRLSILCLFWGRCRRAHPGGSQRHMPMHRPGEVATISHIVTNHQHATFCEVVLVKAEAVTAQECSYAKGSRLVLGHDWEDCGCAG
jgi:hypothetical protein